MTEKQITEIIAQYTGQRNHDLCRSAAARILALHTAEVRERGGVGVQDGGGRQMTIPWFEPMTTTLPWFQPMTIDGTPRRPFFERVPEARPDHLMEWTYAIMYPQMNTDLCRAAVDRWARGIIRKHSGQAVVKSEDGGYVTVAPFGDWVSRASSVTMMDGDSHACDLAHRLADALGIAT